MLEQEWAVSSIMLFNLRPLIKPMPNVLDFMSTFMNNPILMTTLLLMGGDDKMGRDDDDRILSNRRNVRRIAFSDERGLPLSSILGSRMT